MVSRGVLLSGVLIVTLLGACGEEPLAVRLDLCPPAAATSTDLETLRRATSWTVEVWGIESGDAAWRRSWSGLSELSDLDLVEAVPASGQVRIIVEGHGTDLTGEYRLLAVGASELLQLRGSEEVCLCVAPPESYDELCEIWTCSFDIATNQCH